VRKGLEANREAVVTFSDRHPWRHAHSWIGFPCKRHVGQMQPLSPLPLPARPTALGKAAWYIVTNRMASVGGLGPLDPNVESTGFRLAPSEEMIVWVAGWAMILMGFRSGWKQTAGDVKGAVASDMLRMVLPWSGSLLGERLWRSAKQII
jgi:hypothetical protein